MARLRTVGTLHFVEDAPVAGLALARRPVDDARATLVCVHGALDRAGSFARLARRLEGFTVVAYDRRGYQGSRALGVAGLSRHVDDLVAVVEEESRRGPVAVLGHSYGGLVAIGAALAAPSSIDLVLAYESPYPWLVRRPGAVAPASEDPAAEAEDFFRRVVSDRAWERLSEAQRASRRADGPALLSDLRTLYGPEPYALADLTVPLVYAYGGARQAEHYRALAAALESSVPRARSIEIADAPHAAHLSHPERLAAVVTASWEGVCASA